MVHVINSSYTNIEIVKAYNNWIPSLNLLREDHKDIVGGKLLSDSHQCGTEALLLALLAKNMQFQIERGRFVQILNVSSSLWIMI